MANWSFIQAEKAAGVVRLVFAPEGEEGSGEKYMSLHLPDNNAAEMLEKVADLLGKSEN